MSTLDDLVSATSGNNAKIVIIDGIITGDTVVRVGSNTSLLGAAGSGTRTLSHFAPSGR